MAKVLTEERAEKKMKTLFVENYAFIYDFSYSLSTSILFISVLLLLTLQLLVLKISTMTIINMKQLADFFLLL